MRARITQALIEQKNFSFVAIEGDWPDAARIDHYVRHMQYPPSEWRAFSRFPTWMWRNVETAAVRRLAAYPQRQRSIRGAHCVLRPRSVQHVHVGAGGAGRISTRSTRRPRAACALALWLPDAVAGRPGELWSSCTERPVPQVRRRRGADAAWTFCRSASTTSPTTASVTSTPRRTRDSSPAAERYYRTMYYGSRASWNLRDSHMYDTLQNLLAFHGRDAKAVVWAHNSHIGNALATEMSARGEHNIGQLCREHFGRNVVCDRLRHARRHGGGGVELGCADGDQDRAAVAPEQLRAPVSRRPNPRGSCCRCAAPTRA